MNDDRDSGTTSAPEGHVYRCGACGKRARTRYGFDADNKSTALDSGYDESCMMNAQLVPEGPGARIVAAGSGMGCGTLVVTSKFTATNPGNGLIRPPASAPERPITILGAGGEPIATLTPTGPGTATVQVKPIVGLRREVFEVAPADDGDAEPETVRP